MSFYDGQIPLAADLNAATNPSADKITTPISAADVKLVPVAADMVPLLDSEAAGALKQVSVDALKASASTDAGVIPFSLSASYPGGSIGEYTQTVLQAINNIATLRGIAPTARSVWVKDYGAVGSGGGGEFRGVTGASAGTYVDNGGTIIVPTGGDGSSAWMRVYSGPIDVRWFGASTSSVTNSVAIQAALNAAAVAFTSMYLPAIYTIEAGLTWPAFSSAGRTSAVPIIGNGYRSSGLAPSGAFYALSTAGADYLVLRGIQIDTTTGGGVTISGDVGGLHFDNFFMNGCAAGFSAINQTAGVLYTFNVDNSRFWRATGYAGQVLNMGGTGSGINVAIRNSFISQQQRDGDIIVIKDCNNFESDNVQYEGANAATTVQTFVRFTGNCFNAKFSQTYMEGSWDVGVAFNINSIRQVDLGQIYAWSYSTKPNCQAVDISATTIGKYVIGNIEYTNSSATAGTGYVVNDPNNLATISNYHNGSTGAQASRAWTQNIEKEMLRSGNPTLGYVASGSPITGTIQLPSITGSYLVDATIYSQDNNHASRATWIVDYDSGHSFNFTSATMIGAAVTKGSVAPTGLAATVTTAGLVTITATSAQTGTYSWVYSWRRMSIAV